MERVAGGDRAALAVLRDWLRLRFGTQIGLAPPGARPVGDTDIAPGRAEAG